MIALYGWTNTLLFNLANLKSSFYPDTPGDLYVLMAPRVSEWAVNILEESGLFHHVYRLMPTQLDTPGKKLSQDVLKILFDAKGEKLHFTGQLFSMGPKEGYEMLFAGAFWSHTLHMYDILSWRNPGMELCLVEEGYANYVNAQYLQRVILSAPYKERIYQKTHFHSVFKKAKSSLRCNYIYAPTLYMGDGDLKTRALPSLKDINGTMERVLQQFITADYDAYRQRDVYFFASPFWEQERAEMEAIAAQLPQERVVYKPHPNGIGMTEVANGAWVDRQTNMMAYLLGHLPLEHKLMITRNSSTVFYPKLLFEQEPYVMFTYAVDLEQKKIDPLFDRFAKSFKALYEQPDKVMIPRSIGAMKDILLSFNK